MVRALLYLASYKHYVELRFIRCSGENVYVSSLKLIFQHGSELAGTARVCQILKYAEMLHPYDSVHKLSKICRTGGNKFDWSSGFTVSPTLLYSSTGTMFIF